MLAIEVEDEWSPFCDQFIKQYDELNKTEYSVTRIIEYEIKENFRTEGAHAGVPWAQRTRPYPHPPLQKSGQMMQRELALASQKWQHSGEIYKMDFSPIALQATHYSRFFHTGTSKMPPRQTMVMSDWGETTIMSVLGKHLLFF